MMLNFWEVNLGNVLTIITILGVGFKLSIEIGIIKTKVDTLWEIFLNSQK